MRTNLIILGLLFALVSAQHQHNHSNQYNNRYSKIQSNKTKIVEDDFTNWFKNFEKQWNVNTQQYSAQHQVTKKPQTSSQRVMPPQNRNSTSQLRVYHQERFTRTNLWKVFNYLNKGYYTSDARCQNTSQAGSGCCIKGKYYEEEKCWVSLISFSAMAAAFVVGTIFCLLFISCMLTCICVKRCKRQKILEYLKKKKTQGTTEVVNQVSPLSTSASINTISSTQPKCNCPRKHEQRIEKNEAPKQIIQPIQILPRVTLPTTSSDFGYIPPRLNLNQKKEVELQYPKFEEVNVNNPYPKFELLRSKYLK